jgi:tetratricopeptide (TPR) repeat protein
MRQMLQSNQMAVRVWEEQAAIPTYGIGAPDKNPMFLEKRVYQGSSGRVYPHPVIDKIDDEKALQTYRMVILENEYVRIEIMPELGGRIYRALDKTNQYDFVYYNRVIKPALVGLAGPWISGGIEFNWPQHHRPNTYGPVEDTFSMNADGSATVFVSEIDRMHGTKMTAGFTLYPGKAYLEISAQLYNRTPEPQTFLWWANPAVAVNDHTQSVFPPDVTAVFDHGKRDVSRFPIATGTYYKMDYSAGVDISRYKNIPVPTSYMAYKSDYNFVGGYDHGVQAGLLHVANHYVSPGKKQWTWGNGEFGQAWDRNLTDEDGPYIELMTGVYTDNQPDFSWLQPYEEKSFKQYFMPYKNIGVVKNASIEAAVNVEVNDAVDQAFVLAYATAVYEGAVIELHSRNRVYMQETVTLSPNHTFKTVVPLDEQDLAHDLRVSIRDSSGRELIAYQPQRPEIEQVPEAAKPLPEPEALKTNEQLYLAGLHLEQYRHATFEPEAYYLEGLKRDPGDIRINVAYGTLLVRSGLFARAEAHFRQAVTSLSWRNPNPYDSEAYYQLGVTLSFQDRPEEAFAAFYKATWSAAWQDSAYFSLAQIACGKGAYGEALDLIGRSLDRNARNYRARHLKAALLRKVGRPAEAAAFAADTLKLDVADFGAANECYLAFAEQGNDIGASETLAALMRLMRGDVHNYLNLADDYAGAGLYEEAIDVLGRIADGVKTGVYPMLHYTLGYLYERTDRAGEAVACRLVGQQATPDYCFPNSLFDLLVLESAIRANPLDAQARYLLGNLMYDKKRFEEAIEHWEESRSIYADFATVHRNLALAYFNKRDDQEAAKQSLENAFSLNNNDARVFYELDQLYKKRGYSPAKRFEILEAHISLVGKRDDLYLEYVTLLNTLGRHEDATAALATRIFHPWEGGEGKATGQFVLAHVELAKRRLHDGVLQEALTLLQQALVYPPNLGEGKLAGAQENNIYYYLGCVHEALGEQTEAAHCFLTASRGLEEPTSAMYYNDQPPDMIFYQGMAWLKLGNDQEAKRRFNKLVDYAEEHLFDHVKIDYFAVSLPDFLVFEDNLDKRNEVHCRYMRGLGLIGLGHKRQAEVELDEVIRLDSNHQGARIHKQLY